MTLKGGSSQACASCRHRRRKCTPECLLAPYFPPDQQKIFQNAHRLFGVRNIVNILKEIDPSQKGEAMRSIICEANIRETYPVGGCCWVIRQLSLHIQQAEEELLAVRDQLAHYRRSHDLSSSFPGDDLHLGPDHLGQLYGVAAVPQPPNGGSLDPAMANKLESKDNIVNPVWAAQHINNVVINNYHESKDNIVNPAVWAVHQHNNNVVINNYLEPKDNMVNPVWAAQHDSNVVIGNAAANCINDGNNFMALQTQSVALDPMALQQQQRAQGYDGRHVPFFDTIDDRQSYIDSKDAYKSSSESSLKDTMQSIEHVAENELKSAAACFSLTSVN